MFPPSKAMVELKRQLMPGTPMALLVAAMASALPFAIAAGQSVQPLATSTVVENVDAAVFDEVWRIVRDNFVDANLKGVDWNAMKQEYGPRHAAASSDRQRAAVINQMLDELKTSHTDYFVNTQPEYYELLGVYGQIIATTPKHGPDKLRQHLLQALSNHGHTPAWQGLLRADGKLIEPGPLVLPAPKQRSLLEVESIGVRIARIDNRVFMKGILAGSPAQRAPGLRVGDEIISADGKPFDPFDSLAGKAGRPVMLAVQSTPDESSRRTVEVVPELVHAMGSLHEASRHSAAVSEVDGKRLGYLRLWSLVGHEPLEIVYEQLFEGELKDVDGLVLDLRDGWGGSTHGLVELFSGKQPTMFMRDREGREHALSRTWTKPLVVLINEGSRSAKEIIAYCLRKYAGATLVGSRTAGAVTGGMPFMLTDGSLLIVATHQYTIDGENLEGVGVEPDIVVEFDLPYAQGHDPQLDAAKQALLAKLR